ncbi:MAG: hypothetical protein ACRD5L_14875 [Bryobacteraceae bacterium]
MIGEDLVEKVRKYRLAVDAYCDAVDRVASEGALGEEWQQIEVAHDEAERARSAFLRQGRKPLFARTLVFEEISDDGIEELVLGDLGQLGG